MEPVAAGVEVPVAMFTCGWPLQGLNTSRWTSAADRSFDVCGSTAQVGLTLSFGGPDRIFPMSTSKGCSGEEATKQVADSVVGQLTMLQQPQKIFATATHEPAKTDRRSGQAVLARGALSWPTPAQVIMGQHHPAAATLLLQVRDDGDSGAGDLPTVSATLTPNITVRQPAPPTWCNCALSSQSSDEGATWHAAGTPSLVFPRWFKKVLDALHGIFVQQRGSVPSSPLVIAPNNTAHRSRAIGFGCDCNPNAGRRLSPPRLVGVLVDTWGFGFAESHQSMSLTSTSSDFTNTNVTTHQTRALTFASGCCLTNHCLASTATCQLSYVRLLRMLVAAWRFVHPRAHQGILSVSTTPSFVSWNVTAYQASVECNHFSTSFRNVNSAGRLSPPQILGSVAAARLLAFGQAHQITSSVHTTDVLNVPANPALQFPIMFRAATPKSQSVDMELPKWLKMVLIALGGVFAFGWIVMLIRLCFKFFGKRRASLNSQEARPEIKSKNNHAYFKTRWSGAQCRNARGPLSHYPRFGATARPEAGHRAGEQVGLDHLER